MRSENIRDSLIMDINTFEDKLNNRRIVLASFKNDWTQNPKEDFELQIWTKEEGWDEEGDNRLSCRRKNMGGNSGGAWEDR